MREIIDIVRTYEARRGTPCALATLVRSQGSSYRQPGARLLVTAEGDWVGSLSGGCLEEEIAHQGLGVARTGEAALLTFDTRARIGCHGSIDVLVERVRPEFLHGIGAALRERRDCRTATFFDESSVAGSRLLHAEEEEPSTAFVQYLRPPVRLVVVGAGPDRPALEGMARILGWDVWAAGQAAEMPEVLDAQTVVIIGTHNYGRDFAALRAALPQAPRYIGLVGSRRRRDQLIHDLHEAGLAWDGPIFGPAGLDLGGESPEEIALAMVAEIQSVMRQATGQSLCRRRGPIHARVAVASALNFHP